MTPLPRRLQPGELAVQRGPRRLEHGSSSLAGLRRPPRREPRHAAGRLQVRGGGEELVRILDDATVGGLGGGVGFGHGGPRWVAVTSVHIPNVTTSLRAGSDRPPTNGKI